MTNKENYKKSYTPYSWLIYDKLKRNEVSIEEASRLLQLHIGTVPNRYQDN